MDKQMTGYEKLARAIYGSKKTKSDEVIIEAYNEALMSGYGAMKISFVDLHKNKNHDKQDDYAKGFGVDNG